MIINWKSFFILESILTVNTEFMDIIRTLFFSKDTVATKFLDLVNRDITTNMNYIKRGDKNDELKFVNDSQVKRIEDSGENPFKKSLNVAKIGRSIRHILKLNGIDVSDSEVEKFVNLYKSEWDRRFGNIGEIELVSGEEIRKWYSEKNYVVGGGTLNSSCMRYDYCQEYLDIYVKNPKVCQLAILLDESGQKLLGRALLWKLENGNSFLDRIYTRFDNDVDKFVDWYSNLKQSQHKSHISGDTRGARVKLQEWKFKEFPYMDSLWILDWNTGILGAYDMQNNQDLQFELQQTDGEPKIRNYNWSKKFGKWYHISDSFWYIKWSDFVPKSEAVRSYGGDLIPKSEAVWSDTYKSYIEKENAKETELGLVDKNDITYVWEDFEGGKLKNKKMFLTSKIKDSDYKKVDWNDNHYFVHIKNLYYDPHEFEYYILDDESLETNIEVIPVSKSDYAKLQSLFGDLEGISEDLYSSNLGFTDKFMEVPIVNLIQDDPYVAKELAQEFGIKNENNQRYFIPKKVFNRLFRYMIFGRIKKRLETENIPGSETLIKIYTKVHERLMTGTLSWQNTYQMKNKEYSKMLKWGSFLQYYNSTISEMFEEENILELLNGEEIKKQMANYSTNRRITFRLNDQLYEIGDEDSKEKINLFLNSFREQILFYAYFYVLFEDFSKAEDHYDSWTDWKNLDSNPALIRHICRNSELSGDFATKVNELTEKFSYEHDPDLLLNEFGESNFTLKPPLMDKFFEDFKKRFKQ